MKFHSIFIYFFKPFPSKFLGSIEKSSTSSHFRQNSLVSQKNFTSSCFRQNSLVPQKKLTSSHVRQNSLIPQKIFTSSHFRQNSLFPQIFKKFLASYISTPNQYVLPMSQVSNEQHTHLLIECYQAFVD